MAGRTITQRIALEGGQDIRAQLEAIGKAGQDAFKRFSDAANAQAVLSRFGGTLDAIKARAEAVGAAGRKLGQDFDTLGQRVRTSARNIAIIGTVVAGVVTGFVALVKGAGDVADKLDNVAQAIGITTQELERLNFAAEQAGIGEDQLAKSLTLLNKKMGEAGKENLQLAKKQRTLSQEFIEGKTSASDYLSKSSELITSSREQTDALTRLGIASHNVNGEARNTRQVMLEIAEAFKDMPDGANKASLAMELFGSRNVRMIEFLNQGADGIRAMEKEAERIAPALTKLQIKVGKDVGDAFDRMTRAMNNTKNQFLLLFGPTLTRVFNSLTEREVRTRAAFLKFGETLRDKVAPIIDDVVALIDGRDKDVKNTFILRLRDGIVQAAMDLQKAVNELILPALSALVAMLDVVAKGINAVFGTELTGGQIAIALVVTKLIGLFGVLRASVSVLIGVVRLLVVAFGGVPLALAAIGFAIGFFVVNNLKALKTIQDAWTNVWNEVTRIVTRIIRGIQIIVGAIGSTIATVFTSALSALQTAGASVLAFFTNLFTSLATGASTVVANIIAFFQLLPQALTALFTMIGTLAATAWQTIMTGAQALVTGIITAFQTVVQAITIFFTTLPQTLQIAFQAVVQLATDTWNAIAQGATDVGQRIAQAFTAAFDMVKNVAKSMFDTVMAFFERIISAAARAIKAVASANSAAGRADGGAVTAAGGGHIRGRGTSTSDSIAAWLSNNEYVHRAKAVRKYGTNFMHAINNLRIPVENVRALMSGRGFNMGGLAESLAGSLMPPLRLAEGGLATAAAASGGRPVIINFGGESFNFTGTNDVIERITRRTSSKQLRSAGRKPSWYQG